MKMMIMKESDNECPFGYTLDIIRLTVLEHAHVLNIDSICHAHTHVTLCPPATGK